jgi:pSer/pThr/pTyr-binding forkhead associated (FHA) protein
VSLDDLVSKNGTDLRGNPVRDRVELTDGDEIVFGAVRVTLRSWSPASGVETKRIPRLKR